MILIIFFLFIFVLYGSELVFLLLWCFFFLLLSFSPLHSSENGNKKGKRRFVYTSVLDFGALHTYTGLTTEAEGELLMWNKHQLYPSACKADGSLLGQRCQQPCCAAGNRATEFTQTWSPRARLCLTSDGPSTPQLALLEMNLCERQTQKI